MARRSLTGTSHASGQPGQPAIRVYNPTPDEHGWRSTHTVVEIVTDDMPFLVDSVIMELNRHGLTVHFIIHPVMRVLRDAEGRLNAVLIDPAPNQTAIAESVMHCEVNRQTDPAVLAQLEEDLTRVLGDVRAAVRDWPAMRARMKTITDDLDQMNLPVTLEERHELEAFLQWLVDNHFTFLGYRDYDLVLENGEPWLRTVPGSGLGVMRDDGGARVSPSFAEVPPELRRLARDPTPLILSKSSARSTVHRPAHMDYIGVKRFDAEGQVVGEQRFLGLYTSVAYSSLPANIPLLRSKVERVLKRANFSPSGHAGKALQNIIDTYPRDELFQASEDELYDLATGILYMQDRQQLRLFLRQDQFNRFMSCLVYVPREHYNTELRLRMQELLMRAFNGQSATFVTQFSESVLARVHFHVRTTPGNIPPYSVSELEEKLREAMLSWEDRLHRDLLESVGEERGNEQFQRYRDALPAAYIEDFDTRTAVSDIQRLESLGPDRPLEMRLYRSLEDPDGLLHFKVFGIGRPLSLSEALPILERLGLKVLSAHPYEFELRAGAQRQRWVLNFDMKEDAGISVDVAEVKDIFQDAFARVWAQQMENDGFNRLVLAARIGWRDVVVLRAYCKYLLQTRAPFSQDYMSLTLNNHPAIARLLAELFHARLDPDAPAPRNDQAIVRRIEEALEDVTSLDEDRILRRFLAVILATLRSNYYQPGAKGEPKDYLSFKLDSAKVPELPLPVPLYEIWVYSPRMEGVHLRGGMVARGGIRWSDRREDFRTEVLGLMKAQMVKNAVIVPVGAKGGFIVKRPPPMREELQREVEFCYSTLIRGMLDISDNRVGGAITPPARVTRHDGDDPYLVVAADKGTATFSDLANSISLEYGFWLGDAFASGGSAGYDHKKMGITARGAWESVKRHFRELGKDIQARDVITVIGVGDMAGDVFGNGLLQSRQIKLLAAFNHLHVFIDPDPDPQASFQERERLFRLPRSAWTDYDAKLISKGGGVFPRSAKSIALSPEARTALAITETQLTPAELINRILKAPVDLLWNGGIGTYVKASTETHADVGDRANDALRIDAKELRCKIVGEGGNLGFTQLGRIEFAQRGGKILTDAIDNSAGVNCSDHEVNIKILLNQVVQDGDMTAKQRNQLLAAMTDEVAELVLRQNYLQPQTISVTLAKGGEQLMDYARMIRVLERAGKLNRAIEFLPAEEEINERAAAGTGLTAPELAILLAYGKITLFDELSASDVPEDPYLQRELLAYFPKPLREQYATAMANHPLRREIISTYITNSVINRMGGAFVNHLREVSGHSGADIARAYSAAREIYAARQLWTRIDALDNQVAARVQIDMHLASRKLLERASLWLLRNRRSPLNVETAVGQFANGVATLTATLPDLLQAEERAAFEQACRRYTQTDVPLDLAHAVVSLEVVYSALDIIEAADQAGLPVAEVAAVYFALVHQLELNWLRASITALPAASHWQQRARAALLDNLYDQARTLTADVLRLTPTGEPLQRLAAWSTRNHNAVERNLGLFADLRSTGQQPDLAMLSVALRELGNIATD
ncbi:MAG: NAD-glutamate dehydrogenase [Gammaproteobacteria bacterium]